MKERQTERGTFLVHIQFRQKETWQGQVTWAEENKTVSFRSALELLRLLDEAGEAHGRTRKDAKTALVKE